MFPVQCRVQCLTVWSECRLWALPGCGYSLTSFSQVSPSIFLQMFSRHSSSSPLSKMQWCIYGTFSFSIHCCWLARMLHLSAIVNSVAVHMDALLWGVPIESPLDISPARSYHSSILGLWRTSLLIPKVVAPFYTATSTSWHRDPVVYQGLFFPVSLLVFVVGCFLMITTLNEVRCNLCVFQLASPDRG